MTHKKLKEINTENRTYYYLDVADIDEINFDNNLLNKKSQIYLFIYHLSYRIGYRVKPFRIIFQDGSKYITLIPNNEKKKKIC